MGARRVAVLLNRRAQGVTGSRVRWFRAHVPPGDLVVTDDVEQARHAVRAIARAGYDVLVLGGGDGTVMAAAEALAGEPTKPALLPLRLGTGNATHDVCGSSPPTSRGLSRDLARAADPREQASPLSLLDVEGRLTQFAGVGLDAEWAADYAWLVKRTVGNGPWLPVVRGIPGYVATAAVLTIPRLLRRPHVRVRVIADGPVQRLDDHGRAIAEILAGDVVYAGAAVLVAASTVPSYSAGMRFFRHVESLGDDRFELKIATASSGVAVLRKVGRVLRGAADPSVLDFAARAVTIELAEPARYHVGGDVLAATRRITVRTSQRAVSVLRAPSR